MRRQAAASVGGAPAVRVTRDDRPLPVGFPLALRPDVRVTEQGRVLLGGRPPRLARLAADATPSTWLLDAGMADPVRDALPPVDPAAMTVVIPVRDRVAQLETLLASLGRSCPVIVVDDASQDGGGVASVAERHGADLVRLSLNLGPAGARNAGLCRVTSPYVALVDSDVVCEATWLLELARHFADPRVAAVAPRIVSSVAEPRGWGRYEAIRSALDLGPVGGLVRPATRVSYVPTTCLLLRRAALVVGGDVFDADLRVGEDVDLIWRLTQAGWLVRYDPAVTVRHDHPASLRDGLSRRFWYGSSAASLAQRHGPITAPAVVTAWTLPATLWPACRPGWALVAAGISVLGSTGTALRRSRRVISDPRHAARLSLRLGLTSAWQAVGQGSALVLRHWWPAAAMAGISSRRARRALVAAVAVDTAADLLRRGLVRPGIRNVAWWLAGRRLDDLAYGAGVWWGALRARSVAVLLPATPAQVRCASAGRHSTQRVLNGPAS